METTPGIDYVVVLSDLKKRRDDLDKAIAGIEQLMGLPASTNGSTTGGVVPAAQTPTEGGAGDFQVREDAFFGMNIAAAAQKYLSLRKKPATSPEIAAALVQGGLPSQSEKLANTVNSVLTRNSKGATPIFAKVKRGTWGLRTWYPNYRPKDDDKDED